jgi:hypothetical protein
LSYLPARWKIAIGLKVMEISLVVVLETSGVVSEFLVFAVMA